MVNILADASLPHVKTLFKAPFKLTTYHDTATLKAALPKHDILLCRSTLKVTSKLLENCKLTCVATASSGTDHIDKNYLAAQNIKLLDAKGTNADAVADYVHAVLSYLEPTGSSAGVIGVGEVGSRVINVLKQFGFNVLAYDPLKSEVQSAPFEQLKHCDVLCIHANLHNTAPYPSKNLIDADFLNTIKPDTVIINAARGGVVNEAALLNNQKPIVYCTDVYLNEPDVNPDIIQYATLCTPHIAGHTIEAKRDAVVHISKMLHEHLGLEPPILEASIPSHVRAFNPKEETEALKAALDKRCAFLTLRRAHKRHQTQ